ncbi:MAG: hypothetical protein ACP6IP_08580 [Candidatus Njordarchaeia archaeon]
MPKEFFPEKKTPSILFPKTILADLKNKLMSHENETGFYLIGLINEYNKTALVLDYFEFQYAKRNRTHIESDPHKKILILQSLPIGLKLIGNIHSHPFLDKGSIPHPSSLDISTYRDYISGFFGISNSSGEFMFYYSNEEKLVEIESIVIDDREVTKQITVDNIEDYPVIYHKRCNKNLLRSIFYEGLFEKKLLILSLAKIIINDREIKVKWPKWLDAIKINSLFKIPYRIYYHDKNVNMLQYKIKNLFGRAKFYNAEMREIILDEISDLTSLTQIYVQCR